MEIDNSAELCNVVYLDDYRKNNDVQESRQQRLKDIAIEIALLTSEADRIKTLLAADTVD